MENLKLKPCPFCGSKPRITIGFESGLCVAECVSKNCPAEYTENEFDIWNTRTSGWISVADALPHEDESVLCCAADVNVFGNYSIQVWRQYSEKRGFGKAEVTHWMPLPEDPLFSS